MNNETVLTYVACERKFNTWLGKTLEFNWYDRQKQIFEFSSWLEI